MMQIGEFSPISDEDVLREIRKFIKTLGGIETTIISDHILNLLEELNGKLPEDKDTLLRIIDNYFTLSDEERLIYRVGRRIGLYGRLADLADTGPYNRVKSMIDRYKAQDYDQLNNDLLKIMNRYIQ
jgi:hypothetical protein